MQTEKMNSKEKLLAAAMLELASNEFGNHGCNDWNFPDDWTREERVDFVRQYHAWNGEPDEFRENHLHLPDFAVMSFLAHKLKHL